MGDLGGREDGEWTRAFGVHGAGRARPRQGTNGVFPPGQASGGRWPGGAVRLPPFSGLADFVFVPGGRRGARLGRPVVLRAVRPECSAGALRSVLGQPT